MKYGSIAIVTLMAALLSAGQIAAQDPSGKDYGPEQIGPEEAVLPDEATETDDSNAELEKLEAMDGEEKKTPAEAPEGDRKRRGCAVDPSSSTPSHAPIGALLFALGLVGLRKLRTAP